MPVHFDLKEDDVLPVHDDQISAGSGHGEDETRAVESDVRHAQDSAGNAPAAGVIKQLSELARELRAEPDMDALLHHVVASAITEADGAVYGGISSSSKTDISVPSPRPTRSSNIWIASRNGSDKVPA